MNIRLNSELKWKCIKFDFRGISIFKFHKIYGMIKKRNNVQKFFSIIASFFFLRE